MTSLDDPVSPAATLERVAAPQGGTPIHASEGVVAPTAVAPPLAALLTGHVLRDGELILLILRPSAWYIVLSPLRFAAAVIICVIAAQIYDDRLAYTSRAYAEVGALLIAGRVVWSTMQWMARLYVLTDMRIVRLSGVFKVEIFDCPLRKVARTRLVYTVKERLLGLGSIEIVPSVDEIPDGVWQTVSRPRRIHEQVVAAINRAKQSGWGSG